MFDIFQLIENFFMKSKFFYEGKLDVFIPQKIKWYEQFFYVL